MSAFSREMVSVAQELAIPLSALPSERRALLTLIRLAAPVVYADTEKEHGYQTLQNWLEPLIHRISSPVLNRFVTKFGKIQDWSWLDGWDDHKKDDERVPKAALLLAAHLAASPSKQATKEQDILFQKLETTICPEGETWKRIESILLAGKGDDNSLTCVSG